MVVSYCAVPCEGCNRGPFGSPEVIPCAWMTIRFLIEFLMRLMRKASNESTSFATMDGLVLLEARSFLGY